MNRSVAEFTRLVPLSRLGPEPFRQRIVAGESERAALSRRFDLVSLGRLEAEVELGREAAGTILLSATFAAEFEQECIVTLDPIAGSASERFQLRYGPPEAEAEAPAGDDDPAFEPLDGEAIDIGEAVAQEFSLCLPPFPRSPDAAIEVGESGETDDGRFAALAKFRRREPH
ncbi:MAG TPA: YceD family protein [Stellaceae bacterium]|nr:YceD family protein [Stellaceae bacterium]